MTSTAFRNVTPITPRIYDLEYKAVALDAEIGEAPAGNQTVTLTVNNYSEGINAVITSSPSGISVDGSTVTQTETFALGESVTLTTTDSESFIEWSGDIQDQTPTSTVITITMSGNLEVSANYYNPPPE